MATKIYSHITIFFLKIVSYLPISIIYILADLFFLILYYVIGYRKSVVKKNLENSFPTKTKQERKDIEKKFYKHLADVFLETIKYRNMSQAALLKRCRIKNPEVLDDYANCNKSVICIEAHYGNWEWTTFINTIVPHTILSVYKPLHNTVMDKFMKKTREHFGAIAVPKNNILRVLARRQKANKLSAIGLVSDQLPDINKQTYWMPFLNQDTPVFSGAEKMSRMFDLPVLFISMRKIKRGYYEVEFIPITDTPKELPEHELTKRYIQLTEKIIQEKPEYWIWSHKRWKRKRPQIN